ncbi:MAG TPA: succinate dehydrogenase assembly factor 2 [Alphaproteobacteria bacterium]|nr:succinate dehydrogenase assembly factor 2 [Alphaproteobacteria bacterium]
MPEPRAPRLKRLYFRSWHRGTREMDLLLGRFAERCLDQLSEAELGQYEALLEAADPDLYGWILGEAAIPERFDTAVLKRIKNFKISDLTN